MRAGFFVRSFPGFERDSMTIGGTTIVGVAIKILHKTTLNKHDGLKGWKRVKITRKRGGF